MDEPTELTELPALTPKLPLGHQDRFTAEHLDPLKREQIISMSHEGASLKEIAVTLAVSEHTILAVRKQEGIDWRTCTIKALEEAVPLGAWRLKESFRTMDPEKLPIPWAIAVDKLMTLKGEAVAIVEHRHTVDTSSLKSSLVTVPEIDVTPQKCLGNA